MAKHCSGVKEKGHFEILLLYKRFISRVVYRVWENDGPRGVEILYELWSQRVGDAYYGYNSITRSVFFFFFVAEQNISSRLQNNKSYRGLSRIK